VKSTPTVGPIRKVELGQFLDRNTMRFVRQYPHPLSAYGLRLPIPNK
jgi:hypothetical protein